MDRTVPRTGSEEIELYMRTYYSLLRSTEMIEIDAMVESHKAMNSTLHVKAQDVEPDVAALVYTSLRLPPCIVDVRYVIVGQLERSFIESGYPDMPDWERVYAPGRRRRTHFNGKDTLAVFIASRSDIDDLVPILTAYQIEWNKLHDLLQEGTAQKYLAEERSTALSPEEREELALALKMSPEDLHRLEVIWRDDFFDILRKIAAAPKDMGLRLISSSLAAYRRATAYWWRELRQSALAYGCDPEQRPVYFVSSNTHSIVNLLTGFARREEQAIIDYLARCDEQGLLQEYEQIRSGGEGKSLENFLYYVLKRYLSEGGADAREQYFNHERSVGIWRIPNLHGFEIEAQIIELGRFDSSWMDPRLNVEGFDADLMKQSDAIIINIDYPLGLAAYEILSRIAEHVGKMLGVYVMGKAATLNGRVGDIMIPNVVHDEHSQNTYLFHNCFSAPDVWPFMAYGNVLDNQKAISAPGTFLQNRSYMSVFYKEGYTDIEMEGGPYLSAVYEAYRPKRHPMNEIVNLYNVPFDIGFLHYASDKPMSKGQNLGAGSLGYQGIDPTYATSIAIVRRIFQQELQRLRTPARLTVTP